MPNPNSLMFDAAFGGLNPSEVIAAHSYAIFISFLSNLTQRDEDELKDQYPIDRYDFEDENFNFMSDAGPRNLEFDPFCGHDEKYFFNVFKTFCGKKLEKDLSKSVKSIVAHHCSEINISYGEMCGMFDYCEVEASFLIAFYKAAKVVRDNNIDISAAVNYTARKRRR